ncbi:unnamed protein product [Paramecium sonneborni]|uniref:Uncharacterized protein n=1 Tax=Paramecium sonneborni TaxID=65129 RepID=A0A8S1QV36_9CILI|nr:unnamed protein product [Paramecium sonneborni]
MSDKKNNNIPQNNNQTDDPNYALQMQIIAFQDQTINNLKNIIIEKDSELQKKNQENTQLRQQIQMIEKQHSQQQQSHQQENSNILNLQTQHQKTLDELKKLKVIFNQNSNPDIVMESLQIKEQLVVIQQQKNKLEIELKEAQTRLIQFQGMIQELQRENFQLKQFSMQSFTNNPSMQQASINQSQFLQQQYPTNNNQKQYQQFQISQNNEENQRNLRKMQLKNELRQIPSQNRTQAQQRRIQQIEDELNYLEQF